MSGWFSGIITEQTKKGFRALRDLITGKYKLTEAQLEKIEELLLCSDMGPHLTQRLLEQMKHVDPSKLQLAIKRELVEILGGQSEGITLTSFPYVVMIIGVNGSGKTTTTAKFGYKFKKEGKKVLLIAADTYRAASIEQLKTLAERIEVEVFSLSAGADPGAVVWDGLSFAVNRGFDVVLIDTSGRLHTHTPLLVQLKKIKEVCLKRISGSPHEILLVLDATTGQNAISQAKVFRDGVGVTGLVLCKLDGTAKGGVVVTIADALSIPVKFVGIGEGMEDLYDFSPVEFVDALFE